MKSKLLSLLALIVGLPGLSLADAPQVVDATVRPAGGGYTVSVTIRHADTGWDHYADGWSVRLLDGTEIGYRTLYHPHVEEQPFTRSLSGVQIPDGAERIVVVPHDSVHGWGAPFELALTP